MNSFYLSARVELRQALRWSLFLFVDQVEIKFNEIVELIGVVEVNARHRLNRWDGALVGIPGLYVKI